MRFDFPASNAAGARRMRLAPARENAATSGTARGLKDVEPLKERPARGHPKGLILLRASSREKSHLKRQEGWR
jgi:hypothetical protein